MSDKPVVEKPKVIAGRRPPPKLSPGARTDAVQVATIEPLRPPSSPPPVRTQAPTRQKPPTPRASNTPKPAPKGAADGIERDVRSPAAPKRARQNVAPPLLSAKKQTAGKAAVKTTTPPPPPLEVRAEPDSVTGEKMHAQAGGYDTFVDPAAAKKKLATPPPQQPTTRPKEGEVIPDAASETKHTTIRRGGYDTVSTTDEITAHTAKQKAPQQTEKPVATPTAPDQTTPTAEAPKKDEDDPDKPKDKSVLDSLGGMVEHMSANPTGYLIAAAVLLMVGGPLALGLMAVGVAGAAVVKDKAENAVARSNYEKKRRNSAPAAIPSKSPEPGQSQAQTQDVSQSPTRDPDVTVSQQQAGSKPITSSRPGAGVPAPKPSVTVSAPTTHKPETRALADGMRRTGHGRATLAVSSVTTGTPLSPSTTAVRPRSQSVDVSAHK